MSFQASNKFNAFSIKAQIQIVESKLALAKYFPLGLQRTERIVFSCPSVKISLKMD